MTLPELFAKASPLPFSPSYNCETGARQIDADFGAYPIADLLGERAEADQTLLIHAATLLPELVSALSYPRFGNTADLLEKAADFIERLQADTPGKSYFTPHLRRAAADLRAALTAAHTIPPT